MKVNTNAPHNANTAIERPGAAQKNQPTSEAQGKPSAAAIGSSSQVEISEKARLMQKAAEIAGATPEVRKDKIAALKKSIGEGSYQVDSAAIADKLVDEHLQSSFGKNNL